VLMSGTNRSWVCNPRLGRDLPTRRKGISLRRFGSGGGCGSGAGGSAGEVVVEEVAADGGRGCVWGRACWARRVVWAGCHGRVLGSLIECKKGRIGGCGR